MIHGDFPPLRRRPSTQAQGLRHGDDATEFLGGFENNRIPFTHRGAYIAWLNTACQAPLYPPSGNLDRQFGMSDTLGQKMRRARAASGKTQDQVAEQIGTTKGAVSQWENNGTVPELENFRAYCLSVGASADEILLEHGMDPLLRQLVGIWDKLSQDARDALLGNANRLLVEENPQAGVHNPWGGKTPPKRPRPGNGAKAAKRAPRIG